MPTDKQNKQNKQTNKISKCENNYISYGYHGLPPPYGSIQNRNLYFPNSHLNQQNIPYVSLKNIINPRMFNTKNSFGKMWYPNMFIDLNYNNEIVSYINSNGPIGPYFAQGLGNNPRSMFKEVNFGKQKKKNKPKY